MSVQRNTVASSCNYCRSGKEISITHSECVYVALGIQHAMRVRRVLLSSVACPSLLYFATLSHKRHDFRKKKIFFLNFLYIACMKHFSF